jgi:uncharacterized damage-inducible protein DinB
MPDKISPPEKDEYAPFYGDYIERAEKRADVYAALSDQIEELHEVLDPLGEGQARFRPAPGEWSIKEVMGHLTDVERVFSYRLLRISRNDPTPLAGFEQEEYVRLADFDDSALADLVAEFEYLRRANLLGIRRMDEAALPRSGIASGFTVSARALIYMLVGHVDHHMASLQEKYLPSV